MKKSRFRAVWGKSPPKRSDQQMDIRTDLAIEWLDMAAGLGPDDWQQEETCLLYTSRCV